MMGRYALTASVVAFLLATCTLACAGVKDPDEERALVEVEKLGGKVEAKESSPAVSVEFCGPGGRRVRDADLVELEPVHNLEKLSFWCCYDVGDAGLTHLSGLTNLRELDLNATRVSDKGMKHLKTLGNLQNLNLSATRVTDEGLKDLRGLTNLEVLKLDATAVTHDGLDSLKGLTKLRYLSLRFTQVTGAGVAKLQKALPDTLIGVSGWGRD
jgi:Leucine Rich repeat